MSKHHIICVHGIGQHSNNWVETEDDGGVSFESLMKNTWDGYGSIADKFEDRVELHSIHYDDEINKIFDSWANQVQKLKDGLASSPMLLDEIDWYTDAIDKASAAQAEADWKYTHLMDLLLFVGSPTIQNRLITYIGQQIAAVIAEHHEDHISLIAHSMGTAISNKAIKAYFNEGIKTAEGKTITPKGDFVFESVTMVANVSYALSRDKTNHYKGIVRPSLEVGKGCCYKWFNVNHRFDPVGQFLPFDSDDEPGWLDPIVSSKGWNRDIELNKVSSKNIHSINHYFRDPKFHLPFLELVFGEEITDQEKTKQMDAHNTTTVQGGFETLESGFKALDVKNLDSFKQFFSTLKAFKNLVNSYD